MAVAVSGAVAVPPAGTVASAQTALSAIAERARAANLARVEEIETVLLAAASGTEVGEDDRASAERAAHKIAGSAGTFGLDRASRLARELEDYLAAGQFADAATLLPALAAVETLHADLDGAVAAEPAPGVAAPAAPGNEILLAHPDEALAARLTGAARSRGWGARWVADARAAEAAMAERWPDVLLVDPELPPAGASGVLTAAALAEAETPALVLYRPGVFLDRVDAGRSGATGFLDATQPPEALLTAAMGAVARLRRRQRARLLAVDDDPVVLDVLARLFAGTGMDLTVLDDPRGFWDALEATRPDAVLLDVDMPEVTGTELCRLLRADDRWSYLPVLVLTGSVRPEQVAQVFAVGADDYVAKPVLGPELLTRITNRLERVRLLRRMAETDPLTGVANRTAFESAFARLAERGDREGQPVSLALLDVDAFRRLNEEHGHDLGDAVLQRVASVLSESFRGDDVVARWGGKEFVVGMLGLREEEGVGRLAAALETVREQSFPAGSATGPVRVSFSAAVAERRPRRSTTRELYRELAVTIDAARAVGGNRVVPAGWRPDADPSHVDVLLVEDDDALAEVLAHTLQTRGLRGAHLADGLLALERLTGPDPMTARVILLDVDLPGLNGLDLLARLAGAGVLARTRVIMLTARSGEGDVLAALRAGAFDHIAKPFSIPVLMQRVRRAIMEGR